MESVEYIVDDRDEVEDVDVDVKPAAKPVKVKVEADPRQIRAGLAAISLRPPPSSAFTASEETVGGHRTAALCRIPSNVLGPADQPRGGGWPKGSKSRPRICFGLSTPPEMAAKLKAEANLAKMTPSKQV